MIRVETLPHRLHVWRQGKPVPSADSIQHIFHYRLLVEGTSPEAHGIASFLPLLVDLLVPVHPRDDLGIVDELDVARLKSRLHHLVADHLQFQTACLPQSVHDLEELQYQVILPQIVSALEQEFLLNAWLLTLLIGPLCSMLALLRIRVLFVQGVYMRDLQ